MSEKSGRMILTVILTAAVLLGAFLGLARYFNELQDRTIELCVDLNDLKKIAAYDHRPLAPLLKEVRGLGFVSIGVFEEALPDAAANGELYWAKGSGLLRLKNYQLTGVKPELTYVYLPETAVRERVRGHLAAIVGAINVRAIAPDWLEINEAEEQLRDLGLGLSESQTAFLAKLGFQVVPRVWNDPRYDAASLEEKISALAGHRLIIFDGEELPGYPESIKPLADSMKKHGLLYGYVEIVKQDGDRQLRQLMDLNVIRVHSIPLDEMKKLSEEEALTRFVRAAQERKIKVIYIRPFLPPQIEGSSAVDYNLAYFSKIKQNLTGAGFVLGPAEKVRPFQVKGWQVILLGLGVMIGTLFLVRYYLPLPVWGMYLLLLCSLPLMLLAGARGQGLLLQQGLAWLAAVTFPAYGVVATFVAKRKFTLLYWDAALMVVNIIAEVMIGVFLMVGLLADYRFLLGINTFIGVKLALVLPIVLVAVYFIKDRLGELLNLKVKLGLVLIGLVILAALGVLVARSGNFTLPVPGIEKAFRHLLETVLAVRPRTKEFLFGYPLLFLAAIYWLKGRSQWLWLLAALGCIAPISVFNTFSHIHTPLIISLIRTLNGLVIGLAVSLAVFFVVDRFVKWDEL